MAEHQENIRSVQVLVHGVSSATKDELVMETDKRVQEGCGVDEGVIVSKRDPTTLLRVPLPSATLVGQSVPFTAQDQHLETKLAIFPSATPANAQTLPSHALSASDLRNFKPKALCCAACDREVASLTKVLNEESKSVGSGIKDLPSEHWAEMMEVWMCHDDPAFTARLAQHTEQGFWPTRSNLFVGGSYLLVHGEEGKRAELCVERVNVSASFFISPIIHSQRAARHMYHGLQEGRRHSPTGGRDPKPVQILVVTPKLLQVLWTRRREEDRQK